MERARLETKRNLWAVLGMALVLAAVAGACVGGSSSESVGKTSQAYHAHCDNGVQDVDESDTDCGGLHCAPCQDDDSCATWLDCQSRYCRPSDKRCRPCDDSASMCTSNDNCCVGAVQGDQDGMIYPYCETSSGQCVNKLSSINCNDGIVNGDEADWVNGSTECGGNWCAPCPTNDGATDCRNGSAPCQCTHWYECESKVCGTDGTCQPCNPNTPNDVLCTSAGPLYPDCNGSGHCVQPSSPLCTNGQKDPGETGVDCGGWCWWYGAMEGWPSFAACGTG